MRLRNLFFLLLTASVILAAPIDRKALPADVTWVAHFDMDGLKTKGLWPEIEKSMSQKTKTGIKIFSMMMGSDLLTDFNGITVYGSDDSEVNATAVIYCKFNVDQVAGILAMSQEYAESEYNGFKIYSWYDQRDKKNKTGVFLNTNTAVVSQSKDSVCRAIDMSTGQLKSLDSTPKASTYALIESANNPVIYCSVEKVSSLNKVVKGNAILDNCNLMVWMAGESDGNVYSNFDLCCNDVETATLIEKVMEGMKSYAILANADAKISKMIDAFTFKRSKDQLFTTFKCPLDDFCVAANAIAIKCKADKMSKGCIAVARPSEE